MLRLRATRVAVLLLAAFLTLTLALAPRAEAYVYWTEIFDGRIGRANLDGTGVDERFITGARNPNGVAVDASHVYWANWKARAIGRANLDGTGVDQRFITTEQKPQAVAVDAAHVYWTGEVGKIGRANLDGTGVDPDFIAGAIYPDTYGVAVDATHVYWTDDLHCDDLIECGETIGRANLDGTGVDPSFITAARSNGVALDAAHIYWSSLDSCEFGYFAEPRRRRARGVRARRTDSCGPAIGRANLDGTGVDQSFIAPTGPGPEMSGPNGVAVDAAHVYWANYSGFGNRWNYIGRANLDGTGIDRRFIDGADSPGGVAVDALRSFSFGKVKKNKRKGTARLTVKVPGPGRLKLAQTNEVKGATKRAGIEGSVKLPVKSRGNARKKLNRKGKAMVKAEVTYTPDGGDPNIVANTDTTTVKLVKRS